HVGARESPGSLGRLQPRSASRPDREPVSVQDRFRALPGADGRSQKGWRTNRAHTSDDARLGRLVSARRAWRAVDVGTQPPDRDYALAAHARVSEAHGADELSRGRQQRAAVDGGVLLPGRLHALVGRGGTW